MKTKALKSIILIPMVLFLSCKGQSTKSTNPQANNTDGFNASGVAKDTVVKPEVKVRVNKKYSNDGKLLSYDSSYTYSYTGPAGNTLLSNNDSVFSRFKSYFKNNYSGFINPQFNNIFYSDSLFKYDFFNPDYFRKRYELNNQMLDNIFRRMDSLKNQFMQENYPNGVQQKRK